MSRERNMGYIGQVVSGEKLAVIAKQIYAIQYTPESIDSRVEVSDLLLIELDKKDDWGDTRYALVCDEGVGWEQQDRYLINVPTNVGDFGIYNGSVDLSVDVIKSCLTGDTADIADFVRVFGHRLDNNVAIWQSQMKEPVNA
jgi:hypothetical protein